MIPKIGRDYRCKNTNRIYRIVFLVDSVKITGDYWGANLVVYQQVLTTGDLYEVKYARFINDFLQTFKEAK